MLTVEEIFRESMDLSLEDLNKLSVHISDLKTLTAKSQLFVGQNVMIVQKTKQQPGTINKVNKSRCVVDMAGRLYNVPMSMIRPA